MEITGDRLQSYQETALKAANKYLDPENGHHGPDVASEIILEILTRAGRFGVGDLVDAEGKPVENPDGYIFKWARNESYRINKGEGQPEQPGKPWPRQRIRTVTKQLDENTTWLVELKERADEAARNFRECWIEMVDLAAAREARWTVDRWPAELRRTWEKCQEARRKYVFARRTAPYLAPEKRLDLSAPRSYWRIFDVAGVEYTILKQPVVGTVAEWEETWLRHYHGQPRSTWAVDDYRHVGMVYYYGKVFDPPLVFSTRAELGQRFGLSPTKTESALRRYRRQIEPARLRPRKNRA